VPARGTKELFLNISRRPKSIANSSETAKMRPQAYRGVAFYPTKVLVFSLVSGKGFEGRYQHDTNMGPPHGSDRREDSIREDRRQNQEIKRRQGVAALPDADRQ
jgi:hypothetical protein